MKKATAFILCLNLLVIFSEGQQNSNFPVPMGVPNLLFYLQRTPNINTVIYELNLKDGILDSEEPIHIFWIRYADKAQEKS